MTHSRSISLRGAHAHNLQAVDVVIPHDAITVITGVSGSGKSSLAVDCLLNEARRRYLGAVAGPALQRLGKLGRPQVEQADGLRAGVLLGQARPGGGARSTVGTLSGLLDLLRLLVARVGQRGCLACGAAVDRAESCPTCGASAPPLLAGLLSFNGAGACPGCRGLGVVDRVDPDLLVADPSLGLRQGALAPTTPKPYIIYSQVTMEVLDTVCRAHDFTVDTPWADLSDEQRAVVFYGSDRLTVPFGKHPLESRLRWSGITARPREEGHYRGIITTIQGILDQKRNPGVLRFVRSVPCQDCGGSRLSPEARAVSLGGRGIHHWAELSLGVLSSELGALALSPRQRSVASPLIEALLCRLVDLGELGLAHLQLSRPTDSLSGGEARRVQLAGCLAGGLGRLLYVLDEPSAGLHPQEIHRLRGVLGQLRGLGNTVVMVEHEPALLAAADHVVEIGPGAGEAGGRKVYEGALDGAGQVEPATIERACWQDEPSAWLELTGACEHNLKHVDVSIPCGRLVGISGVSGAGKTTLALTTLARGVRAALGLSGPAPGACSALRGAEAFEGVEIVDAAPIGRSPRSNAATYTKLFDAVRTIFARQPLAQQRGYGASRFSFNTKGGRCELCEGAGSLRVGLHFLADVHMPCEACGGARFDAATLEVRYRGHDIHGVLELSVERALALFIDVEPAARVLQALLDVGLGYLPIGQPATTLSGGEARRIKLAAQLARPSRGPTLYVLDEPSVGLHPRDVSVLVSALRGLVARGHTVVVVDHDLDLLRSVDWLVDLGPAGGEGGGRVVAAGTPDEVACVAGSPTGRALAGVGGPPVQLDQPVHGVKPRPTDVIQLRGVHSHNLADLDLDIPHDALTVITGVSGSGKSSLAFDTLHGEAWRRFGSTLPGEARRRLARLPRPGLGGALGLGPSVAVGQRPLGANPRSFVSSAAGLAPLMRLLWARFAHRICPTCGAVVDGDTCVGCGAPAPTLTAGHLSSNQELGACPACEGLGTRRSCDPARLVSHPDRGLWQGAMDGSKLGRHLGEPHGQHLATLGAVGRELGLDVSAPWCRLGEDARRVALEGTGDRVWQVRWCYQRGKRSGEHRFEGVWPGLLALVDQAWDRTHADRRGRELDHLMRDTACERCGGERLAPWPRGLRLGGLRFGVACAMSVTELQARLAAWRLEPTAALDPAIARATADLRGMIEERLGALAQLGLGYLGLGRRSDSLSGGEARRVQLAGLLASRLTGLTCVLDEPSTGLHPRDTRALMGQLRLLVEQGNTVVVVEHDLDLVRAADHLIELGPGAGADGGRLVAQGSPAALRADPGSLTGAWLRGERALPMRAHGPLDGPPLELDGVTIHNLVGLDVSLPTRGLLGVAGVSGSGKSSLVLGVLEPSVRHGRPTHCRAVQGAEAFARVVLADARPIGASPISTPASFTGLLPMVAGVFAASAPAKAAGLGKAAFSYTSPKGRCPVCKGLGREAVGLELLADAWLPCEACGGDRYRPEVLAVSVDGMNIAGVLGLSVVEAAARFVDEPALHARLAQICDLGLGYLCLDQPSASLSGGESRRLRLAVALLEACPGEEPTLFVLDEPSAGLHPQDRGLLLAVLDALVQRRHTVVMVEHDPGLLSRCDHILELGPEGGPGGGRVVASGSPAELAGTALTPTGEALAGIVSPPWAGTTRSG